MEKEWKSVGSEREKERGGLRSGERKKRRERERTSDKGVPGGQGAG